MRCRTGIQTLQHFHGRLLTVRHRGEAASLERQRLLNWIFAWTGSSAAWFLSDGNTAVTNLRVAELVPGI
jgi:streptomycin 6-kinase